MTTLPDFFDPINYKLLYADVVHLSDVEARDHYLRRGIDEGRIGCAFQLRENFLGLIGTHLSTLEIGPFTSPALRGSNVFYFDVADKPELTERAKKLGHPGDDPPEIHFVSAEANMAVIDRRFAQVFSSHCIEHQPDLVAHLRAVSALLEEGGEGRVYLLIPDKRFCFDHFRETSTLASVVGAHVDGRVRHASSSLIETLCMTTHNDPVRHWAGDHGQPSYRTTPALLQSAHDFALNSRGVYVDAHAWQFTPESFSEIMAGLRQLGMIDLRIEQIYQTPLYRFEFAAVLCKSA